jgi:hypothetical protein
MSEKAMARAQAKAQAKAVREAERAEETKIIVANLCKAGLLTETNSEYLGIQKTMEEGHKCACDCDNKVKKSSFYANMYANMAVCFVMFVVFLVLQLMTGKLHDRHHMPFLSANSCLAGSIGAFAADIDTLKAGHSTEIDIVARGLNVDSSTFIADSVCTLTTGSTYPTPSKAFVTKNIGGVTVTDHVMVTPTAAQ